jgi:hypothetical protein
MIKGNVALLPLLFTPLELVAQRYGRPDSAQNSRAVIPIQR